jgi:hypothetical protein
VCVYIYGIEFQIIYVISLIFETSIYVNFLCKIDQTSQIKEA